MPASAEELVLGRSDQGVTRSREYKIKNAADEAEAKAALLAEAPATLPGGYYLQANQSSVDEIVSGNMWVGRAFYAFPSFTYQPAGSFTLSIDISGVSHRVTQTKQTMAVEKEFGYPTLNFGGAINVASDGTVEGVDIVASTFNYTVTKTFTAAEITQAFVILLSRIVGTVNNADWHEWPSGELLLHRVSGLQRPAENGEWDITFQFAVSHNSDAVSIGPTASGAFLTVPKKGWDYLWVYYEPHEDTTNKVISKRPRQVQVERVYDYTNYDLLNI